MKTPKFVEGDTVAFNQSGEVKIGVIIEIKSGKMNGVNIPKIKVRGVEDRFVSLLKNYKSLIKIHPLSINL